MNTTPIARFLESFAQKSNSGDLSQQVAQFAGTFLAAGPQGARCVTADDFARALPKRKQLLDSLGLQSSTLLSQNEIPLSDRFVLVQTQWQMTFSHLNAGPRQILAGSTFIVDTESDEFKIVFYLANQDIEKLAKSVSEQ
jgi:hypothetical protein